MKFAKAQLRKYQQSPLQLDEQLDLNPAIQERFADLIDQAKAVHLQGSLQMSEKEEIVLLARVQADLILPSARSLAPVPYALDFQIAETYTDDPAQLQDAAADDNVFLLEDGRLDLDRVVLDNLVAALPSQVLTAEEAAGDQPLPAGQDWQVISEDQEAALVEEKEAEKPLDDRFAKLDDFFQE
ncbi:YceD family protein [Leuconostocaceae bacterium ESL0958]|nr:YceD family protein [Leuconostocaceae bacterium ESL0958]